MWRKKIENKIPANNDSKCVREQEQHTHMNQIFEPHGGNNECQYFLIYFYSPPSTFLPTSLSYYSFYSFPSFISISFSGSSQTWLQVQQQRLRAKRAQRQREGFDFTDGASRYVCKFLT